MRQWEHCLFERFHKIRWLRDEGSPEWAVGVASVEQSNIWWPWFIILGMLKQPKVDRPAHSRHVSHPPDGFPLGLWDINEQGLILSFGRSLAPGPSFEVVMWRIGLTSERRALDTGSRANTGRVIFTWTQAIRFRQTLLIIFFLILPTQNPGWNDVRIGSKVYTV